MGQTLHYFSAKHTHGYIWVETCTTAELYSNSQNYNYSEDPIYYISDLNLQNNAQHIWKLSFYCHVMMQTKPKIWIFHTSSSYCMTASMQSVKPIIIHSLVWFDHYQTISRLRYNMKPSGSERSSSSGRSSSRLQTAAVIRFTTFHICIQIQKLQMAIEPFLNQYVICWLGEGPRTPRSL